MTRCTKIVVGMSFSQVQKQSVELLLIWNEIVVDKRILSDSSFFI